MEKIAEELGSEAPDSLPDITDQASREELERNSESPQESNVRPRVLTEKGREYRKYLLERELTRTLNLWRKELQNAESALADTSDISMLQQKRNTLEASMRDLSGAHDNLVNFSSVTEINELLKRYDAWHVEHREIFKALNSKILETRSERDERNSLFSSRSKSSRASHQSSLARKADMLTRAAKLETELKFLDAESEKAAELKKIQLMKQLATSQAQIEAVAKLDKNHEFDLAVEANLLEPVVSPHERVLAYLENQTNAGHAPVAMETQTNAGHAPVAMETQTNAGHAPVAMETQTNAVHPPPPSLWKFKRMLYTPLSLWKPNHLLQKWIVHQHKCYPLSLKRGN